MHIRLGITDVTREVTLETDASPEEVSASIHAAIEQGGVLTLTDTKGRQVLVPAARIGYVELGSANVKPVGFGAV